MPLVRISLRKGKPAAHLQAIRDNVYLALRESFAVPENDRFMLVHEHDESGFDYDPTYPEDHHEHRRRPCEGRLPV